MAVYVNINPNKNIVNGKATVNTGNTTLEYDAGVDRTVTFPSGGGIASLSQISRIDGAYKIGPSGAAGGRNWADQ